MTFPSNSRYQNVETVKCILPDGTEVVHLRRRFVPPPERLSLMREHRVVEGDRIDNLSARYLGDPEQYWRICDANRTMHPGEVTETIGRRLRIAYPDGISGGPGV